MLSDAAKEAAKGTVEAIWEERVENLYFLRRDEPARYKSVVASIAQYEPGFRERLEAELDALDSCMQFERAAHVLVRLASCAVRKILRFKR